MTERANGKNKNQILKQKLEENIGIVSSRCTSGTPDKKFIESRERFFVLLSDHPHFQTRIKQLRKKYKLPEAGFSDSAEALVWEHKSKSRYHNLVRETDTLLADFEIPKVYRASVWQFVYDTIIAPMRAKYSSISHYPIFSIIHTDADRDINKFLINPNSLYVEIFEWTTKRDIEKALKKLTQLKKEKLPLKVSKIGDLARRVWLLSHEGLNDHKIALEIEKIIHILDKERGFGYADVAVYRKRYKDALGTLRKL